jgi:IS605 OrfB family transposase
MRFSYQTLVQDSAAADAALCAYAKCFGDIERKLYAQIADGCDREKLNRLKREFLRNYGITGRQFNAIHRPLKGKIDGIKAQRKGLIADMTTRVKKLGRVVKKLFTPSKRVLSSETPAEKQARLEKHHHKKRRLIALDGRLEQLKADHKAGVVHITFGSAKLFRAQFDLDANGYENHEQWQADWRAARSSQFVVLGSKSETAGCQGCVATVNKEDESLDLRVRLPDAVLADPSIPRVHGQYVILKGIRFAHGHENVLRALQYSRQAGEVEDTKNGEAEDTQCHGAALTYRFIRGEKHGAPVWYVHVAVDVKAPPIVTRRDNGAVGVDFNQDHLAEGEIDHSGNLVDHERIDTFLAYKSSDQRAAILGDSVKQVVARALEKGKPIVIEKLDFRDKKAQLEDVDRRRARQLSALAYRQFDQLIRAACFRAGVELIEVSPAYTSVIGAVNHAQIYGISIHEAAAFTIARRGLNMSEAPRASVMRDGARVPTRNGDHATFPLPEDSGKHGWKLWADIRRRLRATLAAYYRLGKHKRDPTPLLPRRVATGAIW